MTSPVREKGSNSGAVTVYSTSIGPKGHGNGHKMEGDNA